MIIFYYHRENILINDVISITCRFYIKTFFFSLFYLVFHKMLISSDFVKENTLAPACNHGIYIYIYINLNDL